MPDYSFLGLDLTRQTNSPIGATGGNLWGAGRGNPDPFVRGVNSRTAYKVRRDAKRTFIPAAGALAAQNALFDPTLALARRGASGYGDLYREEAGKSLDWAQGRMDEFNPETSALMQLLTQGATELNAPGYRNEYDEHNITQELRARGIPGAAHSTGDALRSILGYDRASESRRMQRGQYGAGIAQLGQNYRQSTLAQILGIGPQGSQIMSPIHPTGTEDFLSINLNDILQRRNDKAARRAGQQALWGAGISALGSLTGGGGGSGATIQPSNLGGGANGPGSGPGGWGDYGN